MSDKTLFYEHDLTCKPLTSLKDLQLLIFDLPAWRSLCQPLTPHSSNIIKNSEVNPNFNDITLEKPQSFCHFDPLMPSVARYDEKLLPKLLVCHDMANGYHDDSVIDGTSNYQAYTFYNWAVVDIFCYFSHNLVTIPPLGWINVAHAHGVKVIGTFITEWSEGESFWRKVMLDPTGIENLVTWLVTIARTFKFEGWLINIENKISDPGKLLKFLQLLHKTLHEEVSDAVLIWYDSVTKDGQLSWQNALNQNNRQFFDACDGIFTNYSWTVRDIEQSVEEAGSRVKDLYIGVDVWGRNFYGGGMFNTQEAVKVIYNNGCSMAIFAPAWTHEAISDEMDEKDPQNILMGDELNKYDRFLLRDQALWGSLWPYFKTRLPCTLPFKTSFCRGLGTKRRMYGEVLCNSPWYNLRHMQYQPNSMIGAHGYLLSSFDRVRTVSRIALKDFRGILKMRESLIKFDTLAKPENRVHIADTNALEKVAEEDEDKIKENEKVKEKDAEDKQNSKEDDEEAMDKNKFVSQKCSVSAMKEDESRITKMKNVFKRMFSIKKKEQDRLERSSQTEDIVETSSREPTDPEHAVQQHVAEERKELTLHSSEQSLSKVKSSGHSTTHVPVRINLGFDKQRLSLAYVCEERHCLTPWLSDSFNGGTCLRICPSDLVSEEHRTIRLFQCDFCVGDTLVVCMVTKKMPGFSAQWLDMWLYVLMEGGGERRVQLVGCRQPNTSTDSSVVIYPLDHASAAFRELQTYLVVDEPGFYVPIQNSYGWHIYYFQVPLGRARVTSINLRTGIPDGSILLGHVGLCARSSRRSMTAFDP